MDKLELLSLKRAFADLCLRATGRTTRLIDGIIQKMYENKGEWIEVADHYGTVQSHRMLLDKVKRRMANEHSSDVFEINLQNKFPKIRLVKCSRDGVLEKLNEIKAYIEKEENGSNK